MVSPITPITGLKLNLNVDENRVRYVVLHGNADFRNLVPSWFFELIVDGQPFRKSRRRDVERFLDFLLISENEYEIEEVLVSKDDFIPNDWKYFTRISANYLSRIRRIYGEKFRGFLEAEFEEAPQYELPYEYVEFDISAFQFDKNAILSLSDDEVFFLYVCAISHNELVALKKLVMLSTRYRERDAISYALAFSNEFTLAKLTAGKIFEGWELLKKFYFGTALSQKYSALLDEKANDDLSYLKAYFNNKNLLKRIRDNLAFHYSNRDRAEALRLMRSQDFEYFVGRKYYVNTIYGSADQTAFNAFADVESLDPADALNSIRDAIAEVGGRMCHLFQSLIEITIKNASATGDSVLKVDRFKHDCAPYSTFAGLPLLLKISDFEHFNSSMDRFVIGKIQDDEVD